MSRRQLSRMHNQAGPFKAITHILEDLLPDVVLLQKMPKFQQGCCIRNLFIDEVDFEKAPHGILPLRTIFAEYPFALSVFLTYYDPQQINLYPVFALR